MANADTCRQLLAISDSRLWIDILGAAAQPFGINVHPSSPQLAAVSLSAVDADGAIGVGCDGSHPWLGRIGSRSALPIALLHVDQTCSCRHDNLALHLDPRSDGLESLGMRLDSLLRGELAPSASEGSYSPSSIDRPRNPSMFLTSAQLQVLELLSQGHSNAQIAAIRGTRIRAVEALISRTFAKLEPQISIRGNARVAATRAYLSLVS